MIIKFIIFYYQGFNIETYEIKSTEEISQKYLRTFILTNLINEDITLDKSSYIYTSYLSQLKRYQLLILNNIDKNIHLVFLHKCEKDKELLILEDFFCLFIEKKVFYYQKLENRLDDIQILNFVKNSFNLEDIHIVKEINKNKKVDVKYKFIKYKNSFLFKIFLLYLISLIAFFSIYFYDDTKEIDNLSIESLKEKIQLQKDRNNFNFLSSEVSSIYYKAKQKKVEIISLKFDSRVSTVQLKSKNKKSIYDLLSLYEVTINSFTYDEILQEYRANATIKQFRK